MSESKVWVEAPFKLIPSSRANLSAGQKPKGVQVLASEMCIVHNALLRGLNAVYNQARNVGARGTAKDKLDFANFAYAWSQVLEEHHELEETKVFPDINRITGVEGLMDGNVEEHKAFHGGLDKYKEYLQGVRDGKEEYDGEKLVGIIDSFGPVLQVHLSNEIDTLMAMDKYEDKCDWEAWFKKTIDAVMGQTMKDATYRTDMFPMVIILHDKTFADGVWRDFPPFPWVFGLLLRWLFMNTRKDWWRFSGCDFASQPKELPFA
ncbi:hypothetical protein B0T10DRAFT_455581 [Thelonectria olida]|uniref:Hemerythrin-like domain-containing protein n=1 Tax=Thelonectria olida TaxID=1576542 RepID=A0A9P8WDY3_9HYPO|nr:hypothetical protein B0T10DRAFT_455581 [Thelonectria olida]